MRALAAFFLICSFASPGASQEADRPPQADIFIDIFPDGSLSANVSIEPASADLEDIEKSLLRMAPCTDGIDSWSDEDSHQFRLECPDALMRNLLVTSGKIDFSNLRSTLSETGIRDFDLTVTHSKFPYVEIDPSWRERTTEGETSVRYEYEGEASGLPSEVLAIKFGFNFQHRRQAAMILAGALLGPSLLVLLIGLLARSGVPIVKSAWLSSYYTCAAALAVFHVSWQMLPTTDLIDSLASR